MRSVAALAALVLLLTGCNQSSSPSSGSAAPSAVAEDSSPAATTTPLEGTWTTDLEPSAVRAYIREAGWGRQAEKALLDPEMAGPRDTLFRIDFVGDRFRMSQARTDEQWMSGVFTLDDGTLTLDDEAPVGLNTFRVRVDGDTATFDQPGPDGAGFEFMPGVPGWGPAAVLWCSTTWKRST